MIRIIGDDKIIITCHHCKKDYELELDEGDCEDDEIECPHCKETVDSYSVHFEVKWQKEHPIQS